MGVHERLEAVFRSVFNDDDLTIANDTTADDIEGWDSVAHINLMFAIESAFAVQFAGSDFGEFENVGELEAYLEERSGR